MKTCAKRLTLLGTLSVALSLASGWSLAQQTYRLTDLGTLGGTSSGANAINASGQLTGSAFTTGDEEAHAVLWAGTTMNDLGALGNSPGGTSASGAAINASGQVTGTSTINSVFGLHAFLWDGTTMQDLGTLGGPSSEGRAINGSGQVTGSSRGTDGKFHAFLWDSFTMQDLGTLGGATSAVIAINRSGQVTGASDTADAKSHAFLWDGTTMQDLGTLGGTDSIGWAINDSGKVAGSATISTGHNRAFLWDGTAMKNLGTLGGNTSSAHLINGSGQVAGNARTPFKVAWKFHAFLWTGGTMKDLGTLGGNNSRPNALNGLGQLVGWSHTSTPRLHAFLSDGSPMYDLNALVDPKDPLKPYVTLINALDINNPGQIAAHGCDSRNGECHGYLLSPVAYKIRFNSPGAGSQWKLGQLVPIKVKLIDVDGAAITDARAAELAAAPCGVRFAASGAQTRNPACMKYDAVANQFYFDWALGTTGKGATTIEIAIKYGSPSKAKTTSSTKITIIS